MSINLVKSDPRQAPASSSQHFSTTAERLRSEYQSPQVKGDPDDQTSYILTLQTDKPHYDSMKSLRNTYFPPRLNKIPAHLTLFHALPGDRLEDQVLPAIESVAKETPSYRIRATRPFRLGKGIGIAVADDFEHPRDGPNARNLTKQIHERLRKQWGEWLSKQDSAPMKVHYTIMNKVNDQSDIDRAMKEVEESFQKGTVVAKDRFKFEGDQGLNHGKTQNIAQRGDKIVKEGWVNGLTLWRYDKSGSWLDPKSFKFTGTDDGVVDSKSDNEGNDENPENKGKNQHGHSQGSNKSNQKQKDGSHNGKQNH